MITREATAAEIIERYSSYIERGWKVGYRHFIYETVHNKAKNGVQHKQNSRSRIYLNEGVPCVRRLAKFVELTGTHCTLPCGRTFIGDLRIKSEYLKPNF